MSRLRQTHTYAILEVSPAAYREIAEKLKAAGYGHAFLRDAGEAEVIDMHGIGLREEAGHGEAQHAADRPDPDADAAPGVRR